MSVRSNNFFGPIVIGLMRETQRDIADAGSHSALVPACRHTARFTDMQGAGHQRQRMPMTVRRSISTTTTADRPRQRDAGNVNSGAERAGPEFALCIFEEQSGPHGGLLQSSPGIRDGDVARPDRHVDFRVGLVHRG